MKSSHFILAAMLTELVIQTTDSFFGTKASGDTFSIKSTLYFCAYFICRAIEDLANKKGE